jgi:hypothetical protein
MLRLRLPDWHAVAMRDDWPPPEGVCPRPDCNGVITPESLQLDPRGRGECGRCGTVYEWRDGAWVRVDEPPDAP